VTAFLRQGLERYEKVLYIIDEHAAETILHYLEDDGVDVGAYLSRGQLKILTHDATYVRDGVFDPDGMIALLEAETQVALQEGYAALRVTGEMTWALRGLPGSERLIEYEIKLNTFFPGRRCMALCQYDQRRFAPEILLDVLRTHPIAVVGTEVYDNFYYTPPQEMLEDGLERATFLRWVRNLSERKRAGEKLAEYREHLEDLVEARTRELADVNQRLREEIAEHQRTERALQNSEARYGFLLNSMSDGAYVLDYEWRYVVVNKAATQFVQMPRQALLGARLMDVFPGVRQTAFFKVYQRVMEEREHARVVDTYTFAEGRKGWYEVNVYPIPEGILCVARDITERKRAEERLWRSHERFTTVMDSLELLVYVTDMETYEILFINKYGRDIWGDVLGHVCWQALQKDQKGPCDFCTNDKLLDARGQPQGIYRWEFRNTVTGRWYDVCDRAIPWVDGRIVRLEVAIDITERKEAEVILQEMHQELERQTVELEAANAELSQYAYVVSHDLRAPLRAIRNYADFIREDLQDLVSAMVDGSGTPGLDDDVALYLDGLNKAVNEADALVQDLLALSHIGRKRRPARSVDVGEFLQKLMASLDMQDVEIVMPERWPIIEVDSTLLGQIFQNLIDNAIKFNHTSPKRVELGWRSLDGMSGLYPGYEFFVRDNGIGIDPRYHEKIFQVFERLHTSDEYEGTGAGLAIVKKAVDQLGGTVRLESELGQGSTFYFTLSSTDH
jgi:PAS domain S-box-containing protein